MMRRALCYYIRVGHCFLILAALVVVMPRTNWTSHFLRTRTYKLIFSLALSYLGLFAREAFADIADSTLRAELPEGTQAAVSLGCTTAFVSNTGLANGKITNQRNVSVENIAEVYDYTHNADDTFGLFCKKGWAANGCSSSWMNSPKSGADYENAPVRSSDNGCETTNGISSSVSPYLYLNCCRFASTMAPEDSLGVELAGAPPKTKKKEEKSEVPADDKGKLAIACVTASISGAHESSIKIASENNIDVDDWRSVFVFDPYVSGEDPWGLHCANDWVFASCVNSTVLMPRNSPTHVDWGKSKYSTPDTISTANACRSDDEELWDGATLFATCCKLALINDEAAP